MIRNTMIAMAHVVDMDMRPNVRLSKLIQN